MNGELRLSTVGEGIAVKGEEPAQCSGSDSTGQRGPRAASVLCAAADCQRFPVRVYSRRNCQNGICKIKQSGPIQWEIENCQLCTEHIKIVQNTSDLLSRELDLLGADEEVTFGPQTTFTGCFTQNCPRNS